jgi:hypothetical protein
MAMVDGRPAQYGLSLKQLRELMEVRGREACEQLRQYGGVQEICKKLYTSPTEGMIQTSFSFLFSIEQFQLCFVHAWKYKRHKSKKKRGGRERRKQAIVSISHGCQRKTRQSKIMCS